MSGSNFFDLNSKGSDTDYFGVYIPAKEEINKSYKRYYAGERFYKDKKAIPKQLGNNVLTLNYGENSSYLKETNSEEKNTKYDVDFKLVSLFKFLDLLKKADFNCMELLHTPSSKVLLNTDEFSEFIQHKHSFLKKDKTSFLGFVKSEFKKNGYNQQSYNNLLDLKNFLNDSGETELKLIFDDLKMYAKDKDYISFKTLKNGLKAFSIYGAFFEETVSISYCLKWIYNKTDSASYRKKEQSQKGLYHCLRLIYEASDLLSTGELKIPFSKERRDILLSIKENMMPFQESLDYIIKERDKVYRIKYKDNCKNVSDKIDRVYFIYKGKVELGQYE